MGVPPQLPVQDAQRRMEVAVDERPEQETGAGARDRGEDERPPAEGPEREAEADCKWPENHRRAGEQRQLELSRAGAWRPCLSAHASRSAAPTGYG